MIATVVFAFPAIVSKYNVVVELGGHCNGVYT